jgi:hypothetical protein
MATCSTIRRDSRLLATLTYERLNTVNQQDLKRAKLPLPSAERSTVYCCLRLYDSKNFTEKQEQNEILS